MARVFVPIAWTLMIIVLLCIPGTMLPSEEGFSIPNFDKVVHITLFGGFVFLWGFYFNSRKYSLRKTLILFFIAYLFSNALGISLEFVQKCCIPFRDFSLGDIIADMAGAGIGYGICNLFLIGENPPGI